MLCCGLDSGLIAETLSTIFYPFLLREGWEEHANTSNSSDCLIFHLFLQNKPFQLKTRENCVRLFQDMLRVS